MCVITLSLLSIDKSLFEIRSPVCVFLQERHEPTHLFRDGEYMTQGETLHKLFFVN